MNAGDSKNRKPKIPLNEAIENFVTSLLASTENRGWTLEQVLFAVYEKFFNDQGTPHLPQSIPFPLRQVRSLAELANRQSRITAHIICSIATRPVVTLSELQDEVCTLEGVSDFAALRMGNNISCLPIVQQFFRTQTLQKIAPITSSMFYTFLLCDEGAKRMLQSAADATDLVQSFTRSMNIRAAKNAGIHIQNQPWLVAVLRSQSVKSSTQLEQQFRFHTALSNSIATFGRKLLCSLDDRIKMSRERALPDNEEARSRISFSLVMDDNDVDFLTFPRGMWEQLPEKQWKIDICIGQQVSVPKVSVPKVVDVEVKKVALPKRVAFSSNRNRRVVDSSEIDIGGEVVVAVEQPIVVSQEEQQLHRFLRKATFVLSDIEAAAVARCCAVFSGDSAQSMDGNDFNEFKKFCEHDACNSQLVIKDADKVLAAIQCRRAGTPIQAQFHQFIKRDAQGSAEVADLLTAIIDEGSAEMESRTLLPVTMNGAEDIVPIAECLSVPHFLSARTDSSLRDFSTICAASSCVGIIDVDALFQQCSAISKKLAVVALIGLGIPKNFPFPSTNSIFARAVEEIVGNTNISDSLREVALLAMFHAGNELCGDSERQPPDHIAPKLGELAWIPCVDQRKRRVVLAPPSAALDPNPRMLRMFQGLALFLPVAENNRTLSVSWLSALGVAMKPTAELAIRMLSSISPGTVVPKSQIFSIYSFLSSCPEQEILSATQSISSHVIVIPQQTFDKENDALIEVTTVLGGASCCWKRVSVSDDEQRLFHRSLSCFFDKELESFFTTTMSVSSLPTIECWISSMRFNRDHGGSGRVISSVNESTLRTLSIKCFRKHLLNTAHSVELVHSLPQREPLIPLLSGWKSTMETVYFVEDQFSLANTGPHTRGLNVWIVGERIEDSLKMLLLKLGLKDFSEDATVTIKFDAINICTSAALHNKVASCTPFIQSLIKGRFPDYYARNANKVASSIARLSVLLCKAPVAVYSIAVHGESGNTSVSISKSVRFIFDRRAATLYSSDEEAMNHVTAEAVSDVFCPEFDSSVCEAVRWCLQLGFRATRLEQEMKLQSIFPFSATDGTAWAPAATFSDKFRIHYPPGTDGLGQPTLRQQPMLQSAELFEDQWGSLSFASEDVIKHQIDASRSVTIEAAGAAGKRMRAVESGDESDASSGGSDDDEGNMSFDPSKTYRRMRGRRGRKTAVGTANISYASSGNGDADHRGYSVVAEKFVFDHLRATQPSSVSVQWMNETGEQGTPYDIALLRQDPSSGTMKAFGYIEVKCTNTSSRKDFELSIRELLFAARFGRNFSIYRVYNATENTLGMGRMKFEVFVDPVFLWQTGKLTLTGDIKVLTT